jgi:hypothetical protein
MFGYLHPLGVELPRALLQVGQGLTVALTDGQLEQSDGQDPASAVTAARDHLDRAAELCIRLGNELAGAQNALREQTVAPPPAALPAGPAIARGWWG